MAASVDDPVLNLNVRGVLELLSEHANAAAAEARTNAAALQPVASIEQEQAGSKAPLTEVVLKKLYQLNNLHARVPSQSLRSLLAHLRGADDWTAQVVLAAVDKLAAGVCAYNGTRLGGVHRSNLSLCDWAPRSVQHASAFTQQQAVGAACCIHHEGMHDCASCMHA